MKQLLCQPQPTFQFALNLQRARERFRERFWARGNQWLKDATIANWVAQKSNARFVNLIAANRPDFEVTYHRGLKLQFEATYADLPGRKIAQELIEWQRSGLDLREDPFSAWQKRRAAIPGSLHAAASAKARKGYNAETCLVIYLNLGTYDEWRDEIERELVECTAPARQAFRSTWVLWSGRLYRCWPQPFLGASSAFRPGVFQLGREP